MDVPQADLPADATIIDTNHLRLLNEIADLAERAQEGEPATGSGYIPIVPTAKQLLRQRLLDLRLRETR